MQRQPDASRRLRDHRLRRLLRHAHCTDDPAAKSLRLGLGITPWHRCTLRRRHQPRRSSSVLDIPLGQFFPLSTSEHILPLTGATHSIGVLVALGATNIDIYASSVGNNALQLLAARKHLHQLHYRSLM